MTAPLALHVDRTPGSDLATDVVVDLSLEALEADPYPTYAWLRENAPVAYVPASGRVLVTTYALCEQAGVDDTVFEPAKGIFNDVYGEPNVISLNGSAHRDLRNAINPPFRPRAVAGYRETLLRATAARYVEAVAPLGRCEATSALLEPISQRAVGDVLGFTDVDDATLGRWFHDYAAYLVDFGRSSDVAERGRRAKTDLLAYLDGRLGALAADPDDSALSHMLHDGLPEGQVRPVEDLIGSIGVLVVGGFQEPAHGAANALLGVLGRPDAAPGAGGQADRLRAEPATWVARCIEEGLRWLSPFGITEKVTVSDAVLGGLRFPAGTEVGLMIGSANRDPGRWPDRPDEFDLDRPAQAHVAFGYGTHFCIGHSVAKVLGQVVLEEMFARLPNLRLDPDAEPVVHGWATRGATTLPLAWDA
ncbi:MAG: cytochrome P450 [Actinobacteria bacterium]|nr:cytochrome P450 [Actinomycetota bacterium]